MANPAHIKPLVKAILHLKGCEAKNPEECEECVYSATRVASLVSEVTEVCNALRKLLATAPKPPGAL